MLVAFCLFIGGILTLAGNLMLPPVAAFFSVTFGHNCSSFPFQHNNRKARAGHRRTENENNTQSRRGSMLGVGAEGNSIQFSPTYLHPLRSVSDFPTLAGMPAARERPVWCGYRCWPASATALPAWRQPRPQNQQRIPPWDKTPKLTSALNSARILKCFTNCCFHLWNKSSPLAWNLHTSDDSSYTRKLDLGFEYCQACLLPTDLSFFYKGLFSARDGSVNLQITLSLGEPAGASLLYLFLRG